MEADVRAGQEGRRIVVRSPDRFEAWLGEIETGGMLDTIQSFFR
jgi:hypothetical protein